MSIATARGPSHDAPDARWVDSVWGRPELTASLRVVLDTIVAEAGFEVADVLGRISDEEFRLIASSGMTHPASTQDIRIRAEHLEAALERAERWGALRFVHTHTSDAARDDDWHPDDWQPGDALYVPFLDGDRVVGVLSVDVPADGRRPTRRTREQLASLARLAESAVAEAIEATEATEAERPVRHRRASSATRSVVRRTGSHVDAAELLGDALSVLVTELGAVGAWARLLSLGAQLHVSDGWELPESVPDSVVIDMMASGARCWESQRVLEIAPGRDADDVMTRASWTFLTDRLAAYELGSLLQVPLGADGQYLGYLVLARDAGAPAWALHELDGVLGTARELGRATLDAQTLGRERRLIEKLQQVDEFKRDLVSLFSHELRTPLTSLGGHLELLEYDLADLEVAATPLAAMRRAVDRLGDLVQDLILLSRLIEPGRPLQLTPTELGGLVAEATADLHELARARSTSLRVELPDHPVRVEADGAALVRAVATLVADLMTFTPSGGSVHVVVSSSDGQARISITETGEGTRSATRARLFSVVLRGVDPSTRVHPGGLDLRITERIVARHDGRIDVAIDPDAGSRLLIVLPLADAPPEVLATVLP